MQGLKCLDIWVLRLPIGVFQVLNVFPQELKRTFSKDAGVTGAQLATFIAGNSLTNWFWIRRNPVVINSNTFLQKALGILNRNNGTL